MDQILKLGDLIKTQTCKYFENETWFLLQLKKYTYDSQRPI